ncbi:hypothetical protein D3C84_1084020 [compost metagenome]
MVSGARLAWLAVRRGYPGNAVRDERVGCQECWRASTDVLCRGIRVSANLDCSNDGEGEGSYVAASKASEGILVSPGCRDFICRV